MYGEFRSYLSELVMNLKYAKRFAANDLQKQIVQKYIDHFTTGNV
jgi:hypothetical protein